MKLHEAIEKYEAYLVIEKSLSKNSVEAYLSDLKRFAKYCGEASISGPDGITSRTLNNYLDQITDTSDRTQARTISAIRSFFKYLVKDGQLQSAPIESITAPRIVRKAPVTLTDEEFEDIKKRVEMYKPEGHRNKAMIETLYSCGLRVSELIGMKLSNVNLRAGMVTIDGEGNKARTLKLSAAAKDGIKQYLKNYRDHLDIRPDSEDILFLNKRGGALSRVMVFNIIKHLACRAGIKKSISPHTFRHSFAAHLIDDGADLQTLRNLLGHESILTTEVYIK